MKILKLKQVSGGINTSKHFLSRNSIKCFILIPITNTEIQARKREGTK